MNHLDAGENLYRWQFYKGWENNVNKTTIMHGRDCIRQWCSSAERWGVRKEAQHDWTSQSLKKKSDISGTRNS